MIRKHLTYANVMATVAVFIALGGTGYAAFSLPKNSVGTAQLRRNAVVDTKIRANAVGRSEIRTGAVGTAEIRNGSIRHSDLDLKGIGEVPKAASANSAFSAASAARSDTADNASKLGGLTADQLKVRCPDGTIAEGAGCIETAQRAADTFERAISSCGGFGRLPDASELLDYAKVNGGSGVEWTSDLVGGGAGTAALVDFGTKTFAFDALTTPHPFRCMRRLAN